MVLDSARKWIRRGYDQLVHGYDTTRNIFVGNDGSVTYLEDIKLGDGPVLGFPVRFAEMMTEVYHPQRFIEPVTDEARSLRRSRLEDTSEQ